DTSLQGERAAGENPASAANTQAIKAVKDRLKNIFAGQLQMYSMEVVSIEPDKPGTSEISSPQKPADEKSATDKAAAQTPPTGTVATLKFPDALNYSSLESMLNDSLKANSLPETTFDLSSSDKEYTPGSSVAVQDWTVRSTLTKEQTETLLATV